MRAQIECGGDFEQGVKFAPGWSIVGLVVGVWLFSGVMTRVSTKAYMKAESITEYQKVSNLSIIDEGVSIVLIIVAGTLVNTIARNQENLVRNG